MATSDNKSNSGAGISATELVLDLLATHEAHELSAAALCHAAALFGMTEPSVRVALTRLVQQGKVSSPARGSYAWNPAGSSLFAAVRDWLRKDERTVPWHGDWVGVMDAAVPRRQRVAWRRHQRALELRGFQPLTPGLHLRPNNLGGGIARLRGELQRRGLAETATVLGVHALAAADERRARSLWDVQALQAVYRSLLARLEASDARLGELGAEAAAVESLLLGRAVIRQIVRDPLLPEALCPGAEREALIVRMQRYQDKARAIWLRVLDGA